MAIKNIDIADKTTLDVINNKIGTSIDNKNIFEKLDSIGYHVSLTGIGATVYEKSSSDLINYSYATIAKFIAPIDGIYKFKAEIKNVSGLTVTVTIGKPQEFSIAVDTSKDSITYVSSIAYSGSIVGNAYYLTQISSTGSLSSAGSKAQLLRNSTIIYNEYMSSETTKNANVNFYCKAGEQVILWGGTGSSTQIQFSNVQITYQPKDK